MKHHFYLPCALALAGMFMLPVAQAANISKDEYKAGNTRIDAEYKTDKAACKALKANAKDVCMEEAKGKEKVARAELKYNFSAKPADQTKLMEVKADAAYAVAKEKCDDATGNAKDVCVKEAKAVHIKALADTKMNKKVAEAKKDSAQEKRDADYKVAAEKCDAMAGDAKDSCMKAAKAKFGKS